LDVSAAGDSSAVWIYALVSPFPTVIDGVTLDDIRRAWVGASAGPFGGKPFRMDETTLAAFTSIWGSPAAHSVYVVPAERLLDLTWTERPIWAIVPFEALEPRWKVLSVDGQSPIHKDFDPASYPLEVSFAFQPAAFPLPATNRDSSKLTVLAMTGVTALVRGTADRMEKNGFLYPDVNIRDVLRSADITHISNEVSFDPNCPTPDLYTASLRFCSDPRYIALLEDVGTKVVELTGNHLLDYGPADLLNTLEMYNQRGWIYYGGGKDLVDAQKFITIDDHGNKLAFLGCNPAGPPSDWAAASSPGSAPCDYAAMESNIALLRSAGYLPIVTLQYHEYTTPTPTDYEQGDFRNLAAAGAVVVSGSQAHIPQTMEFYDGSFIHYGLGNLFFDQMSFLLPNGNRSSDSRNEFVDRYVFYSGKLISVELLTFRLEDYSQPRPMTPAERGQFLMKIFGLSGW
jgi:poly-gamma-glutamate synthesis protein (capsule biosynthesis protein)